MIVNINDLIESHVTSLPAVYFKLERALKDENTETEEIGRIVEGDPGLSVRLLKIANSPLWGLSECIETIPHALTIVGREELKLLALSTVIKGSFSNISKDLIDLNSFWQNSIACGVISREIGKLNNCSNLERYFMAGMLHNIGSLVIFNKAPKVAKDILLKCKEQNESLFVIENQLLGYNHCDVGAGLLKLWEIPTPLVETAYHHHDPDASVEFPHLVWAVHLADTLTLELEIGANGDRLIQPLEEDRLKKIGLNQEEWEDMKENIPVILDDYLNYFN
jgi:HD-like signal output (HDOD) protein